MPNSKTATPVGWHFDNSYIRLPKRLFTAQHPVAVSSPRLMILNEELAAKLELDAQALRGEEGAAIFAGNVIPDGAEPIAQAYAGHQFGSFTMLGDGRAILLGEHVLASGERYDIQLKGSGVTPYSRGGDGRATLGPMLREYIISEAMHALDIPTTRSLAVVTTGEEVARETWLPGAILTRVASSHLRVGTFEFAANFGNEEELRALADYAIKRHYPQAEAADNRYLSLLEHVIECQAELVAKWQLVGFIHGVMNTDNMTISGETIDYGPCAFMDRYDPKIVFSSIDVRGRYAYRNQPHFAGWNLARFAESLIPILHDEEAEAVTIAQQAISQFIPSFQRHMMAGYRSKLGLFDADDNDEALINDLLHVMEKYRADYTNTFRALTLQQFDESELFTSDEFKGWYQVWQNRLNSQRQSSDTAYEMMSQHNPAVIPRNHRVEEALAAAVEDQNMSVFERLLEVVSDPYAYTSEQEQYAELPRETSVPYQTFCGT